MSFRTIFPSTTAALSVLLASAAPAGLYAQVDTRDGLRLAERGLASDNRALNEAALRMLRDFGPDASPATAAVVKFIRATSDPTLKADGIRALGQINPQAGSARPIIVESLADPDRAVRAAAAEALHDVFAGLPEGPQQTGLFLNDPNGYGLAPAAAELVWQSRWEKYRDLVINAIEYEAPIREALRSQDPVVAGFAVQALAAAATKLARAYDLESTSLPSIDGDFDQRQSSFVTAPSARRRWALLAPANVALARVVPDVDSALRSPDARTRLAAAQSLVALSRARASAQNLIDVFVEYGVEDDPSPYRPRDPFGPGSPFEVPGSGLSLPDDGAESGPRLEVIHRNQPGDSAELPAPRGSADLPPEPGDPLLESILQTLRVGSGALNDPSRAVRLEYLRAIEALTKEGHPLADLLARATRDPDRFVNWEAARTLGRIAPGRADVAVPALIGLLGHADSGVRLATLQAVANFGDEARSATDAVATNIQRGDVEVRVRAVRTIPNIQPDVSTILDVLLPTVTQPDNPAEFTDEVRFEAINQIGRLGRTRLGGQLDRAIAGLRPALTDRDERVRRAAAEAILRLGAGG